MKLIATATVLLIVCVSGCAENRHHVSDNVPVPVNDSGAPKTTINYEDQFPIVVAHKQLETKFLMVITIGEVETEISPINMPTTGRQKITLPSDFSNWDCGITAEYVSPDGKEKYRNVYCIESNSNIIFLQSIECPADKIGSNMDGNGNAMCIISTHQNTKDNQRVNFHMACDTHEL